jgi:hypothetical protein
VPAPATKEMTGFAAWPPVAVPDFMRFAFDSSQIAID